MPWQNVREDRPMPPSPALPPASRSLRGEPNYDAEMRLPEGKTCADCKHGPLCDGLFAAVRRAFTSCDFWPSRYIPVNTPCALVGERGDG